MSEIAHLDMEALVGNHGVGIDKVLEIPALASTEGLESIEFNSAQAEFRYSEEDQTVYFHIPDNEPIDVTWDGYVKAMRTAGFPESVINNYPASIMVPPLNFGFVKRNKGLKACFRREMAHNKDGGEVEKRKLIAFTKPSLDIVSVKDMIRAAGEVLGPDVLFERLDHDLNYTNCSIIIPNLNRQWQDARIGEIVSAGGGMLAKETDIILGGINWQTSVMGEHPLEVDAYIYRLICGNGMCSADHLFKWSRNTAAVSCIEWFKEMIGSAREGIVHEFDRIESLRQQVLPPDHMGDVINGIFHEYNLSEKVRAMVLEQVANEPPANVWELINVFTALANHDELSDAPQMIRRIQKIGGDMATRMHLCPTCHIPRRE